ncbi:MAG TPA: hypothetical protein VER12_12865 [Polyangiaceae bacterium]|nr:hypothetical protein [Polyangiaceae bacterium]HYQ28596.1 hypothetical protein [Polyangiaceae bacterium]
MATLEYETAPSCPAADALEGIVESRLGYDPFTDGAPNHVLVSISQSGASLNGRIEWRNAQGQWTGDQSFSMANGDCLRLVRTMGLALAVQIQLLSDLNAAPPGDHERALDAKPPAGDSERALETKPSPKAASETAERPPPPKPKPPDQPESSKPAENAQRPTHPLLFGMGAGPALGLGMAPQPIVLGRFFGTVAFRRTLLELAAEMSLPATARRADGAGVSVQFRLLSAAGCGVIERWNACLLVNAGQVSLAGEDIDHPTSTHLPYVAAGARAAFNQPLGSVAFVQAHANGFAILTRWTASLDDVPVWTMPRLALTLGVDLGVQFR